MPTDEGPYFSAKEVAELKGVSVETVYLWMKRGLPSIKLHGKKMISERDLEKWQRRSHGGNRAKAKEKPKSFLDSLTVADLQRARNEAVLSLSEKADAEYTITREQWLKARQRRANEMSNGYSASQMG